MKNIPFWQTNFWNFWKESSLSLSSSFCDERNETDLLFLGCSVDCCVMWRSWYSSFYRQISVQRKRKVLKSLSWRLTICDVGHTRQLFVWHPLKQQHVNHWFILGSFLLSIQTMVQKVFLRLSMKLWTKYKIQKSIHNFFFREFTHTLSFRQ